MKAEEMLHLCEVFFLLLGKSVLAASLLNYIMG